ncbi:hypothetical protein [Cytobacillus oceanisediminis]|uniref:hypothetical protein n=1 Tax=Cytobacillus oceanisediminis TaxID=665099 RepID=UPI001FB33393|nr:hypothetical protein [Cytobacillus oceanisediminis]UOE57999.1 hypothetical protein IRB79_27410 [Cytobacillus oceanisediminis]
MISKAIMNSVMPAFNILHIVKEDLNWSRSRWTSAKAEEWIEKLAGSGYRVNDPELFFLEVKSLLDENARELIKDDISPEFIMPISEKCDHKHHEHVDLPSFNMLSAGHLEIIVHHYYCPLCNTYWVEPNLLNKK